MNNQVAIHWNYQHFFVNYRLYFTFLLSVIFSIFIILIESIFTIYFLKIQRKPTTKHSFAYITSYTFFFLCKKHAERVIETLSNFVFHRDLIPN